MALDETKINIHKTLKKEKHTLREELVRIKAFKDRDPANKDNKSVIADGMIKVKVAGLLVLMPMSVFTEQLDARETALATRISEIDSELDAL